LAQGPADILGRPLDELRQVARREAVAAARAYHAAAGETIPNYGERSLVMAGHQPELFHPGVWVKNFALNGLARAHDVTPLNLVVDNDTAKTTALNLPGLSPVPHRTQVAFDHWTGEEPYEERVVRDEALFTGLPEHITPLVQDYPFEPLLPGFWNEVCRQAARTPLLGERLAGARRTLERQWGCHNLEVPVSALCRTEAFAWFAGHLVRDLPRFHAIYNRCVHDYRRRYGIRSRNHPVPDLAADGDWLETPLWIWRTGQHQRGRLFARHRGDRVELRAGPEPGPALPLDPKPLVTAWRELEARGLKVRSRALTNTLFARLFLCDVFIHGIGGGKYDELTDALIEAFYQAKPPSFVVLSATLLLPFSAPNLEPDDCRRLAWEIRDRHYNPQRYLSGARHTDPVVDTLVAEKEEWIHRQPSTPPERRERFQMLRQINERLRRSAGNGSAALLQEQLQRCEEALQARDILERRDYAFCLYPESVLRPFCTRFLGYQPEALARE
jgi:hypothetical protein